MHANSLQRTPERPGRAKRGLLEAASPFSLFAKELPPITPPRNQWDSTGTFSGCPGFTGLSPAMAGFTTPKLATETTATPSGGGDTEEKGGETALVKLEDQQTGSKGNSRVSMFPPEEDAKVEAPSRWRGGSAQHGSAADLFYSSIDRLKSPVYSTPEGSSERHEQMDSRGARGAERCPPNQPLKSHTSTRQDARETRQSKGQSIPQPATRRTSCMEEDNSVISAIEPDMRADPQQPVHTSTARGWETKFNAAGSGGRTWQYGQLKSPPDSGCPAAPFNSLQSVAAAATASLTSPALKAVMAAGGRVDHRLQSAAAVAALSAAAAATPVSRRLSSTSSGQGDSVVPPTTPDDETKARCAVASTSEQPKRCNCKKSRCLKLYCDCFAAGQYCKHACSCQSCLNNADNKDVVVSMRDQVRQRNPQAFQEKIEKQANGQGSGVSGLHKRGCHCKKSHCKKKYCECFQAGVNCGVHCKCDECHNTVEDGLPPPPRANGKQAAAASATAPAAVTNPADRNKTSPGTPPAPGKETTSLDARRTSSRSVKRKAWTSSAPAASEQPRRLPTPSTDSSASQHRAPSAGVLSPPDMVWPANTLAQAQGHVLGSATSSGAQMLSPPALFDHSSVSRILGRTALEQASQQQLHGSMGGSDIARLLSTSLDGRRDGEGPDCAAQPGPSPQRDEQSPAEGRGHIDGIGQCFVSSTPGGQALFPLPLLGLNTQTRPDAGKGIEMPAGVVMGRVSDEASLRLGATMEEKEFNGEVSDLASFEELAHRFHASTSSQRHPNLRRGSGGMVALPRMRNSEFSLAQLAAAEEALCTATPWTEQQHDALHRPGHRAPDMDVDQMMLGPEGVTQPSLLERAKSIVFKAEDPMQTDQASLKRGLWMGQQTGRKKTSHAPRTSQVRKLTDVPRLAAGSRRGAPQRAASLPAPQASIAGAQSALTRSHSSAEDTELLSPSAPSTFGQGQMLRMGAGRTLISPK